VRGLKSSSRDLNNASVSQVRQGSGQPNIRLLLTGKVYRLWGYPSKWLVWLAHGQGGLVHNINSASGVRAIDNH